MRRLSVWIGIIGLATRALCAAEPAELTLKEYLGHNWQHEPVFFPVHGDALKQVKKGRALCGTNGVPISYQIVAGVKKGETRLAFQTDLSAYETRAYRFTNESAALTTDLTVEETADTITLTGSQTGIRIAKTLAADQGPIQAVRLPSGAWVGGSRLTTDKPVTSYKAEIAARGPVFAEAVCRTEIDKTATWELRIRLYAGEPVVLVDETSVVDGPTVTFTLDLKRNFNPDTLLYRLGKSQFNATARYGRNTTWKLEPGEVYLLEPWLAWQERERRGNYFGLFREDGNDVLAIAAREAGAWVNPAVPADKRVKPTRTVMQDEHGLHLDFPLKIGGRKWMFITLPKEPCLAEVRDEKIAYRSPLPYRYLIKYGHFPLDLIKDYVLEWDASRETHPRLLITTNDLDRFFRLMKVTDPSKAYGIAGALSCAQSSVEMFMNQNGLPYGSAPHMDSLIVISALNGADIPLRDGIGTPEERQRLRALLAFLGYTIARPEYWSPERGYCANPNMTTMVAGYRVAAGALLSSHPCAKSWLEAGMNELKRQMNEWSDDDGGWLEAPHYAMVSYDFILAGYIMAYNSMGDKTLFSPRMQKIIEWFGKISTPPDSRFGGFRHMPPIGNTYLNEPSGEFGILARLYKDRDPEFSAQMQWLFQQHRSYEGAGIGGSGHSSGAMRPILVDASLPAKPPAYGTEWFSKTGVILRNGFPSDRETSLYLIAGRNHEHYDFDHGSITIWGKGRIVADDFGYNGRAPMEDHSMLEVLLSPEILDKLVMDVKEFAPAPRLDYVRGVAGGWTRQIAFVKDPDPLAPNYFVVADALDRPAPATWRLWFTAERVTLSPQQALVVGKEDVDTDVFFLQPQGGGLKTEDKNMPRVTGLDTNGNYAALSPTQIGIVAPLADATRLSAVLYPRLKTDSAPTFKALAGGKAVKIQHAKGTDYVFLASEPFSYAEDDIAFEGTAGAVLLRGDNKPVVVLGSAGRLSAKGETVTVQATR
jgi:hypothetical protein